MDSCSTTTIRSDYFPVCSQSRLPLKQGFIRSVFLSVQDGVCQVFLYEGHVVVRAGNSEIKTPKTYNDDNSHYISIYNNLNGYAWKFKQIKVLIKMEI